ncbi:glycine cleavage system protein GcvH [Candidatus Sumerlaeota bacterium]|nr:glycine cleavage system protein GcvH [Candidatus Sumerlaeota bacterium]
MSTEDLRFTKEHEWVRIEGAKAVFGLSDYAQRELGDITFIELPPIGKQVAHFEAYSTVESVKAANDVYAPLSGEVIAVNSVLENAPEKINQSPYDEGWICRIRVADPGETADLMDAAQYEEYTQGLKS